MFHFWLIYYIGDCDLVWMMKGTVMIYGCLMHSAVAWVLSFGTGDLILGKNYTSYLNSLFSRFRFTICRKSERGEGLVGCGWILDDELLPDDRIAVRVSFVRFAKSYLHLLIHPDV